MNKRDLFWFLAYPLYQIIGTFRHEGAHALGVLLFGGEITAFAVLPTNKYWGYVDWEGPTNIFITAAPYLLDLFTFLLFFVICVNFGFRRHWLWLNLVILGVISPLVNSAYNYGAAIGRPNDIATLLHDLNPLLVHCYFILTISLYLQGLYFLFTRSNQLRKGEGAHRQWTFLPSLMGGLLLISACGTTLAKSMTVPAVATVDVAASTSVPTPQIRSATLTPADEPSEAGEDLFERVLAHMSVEYPRRGPAPDLSWEGDFQKRTGEHSTSLGSFVSGSWSLRIFDKDLADEANQIEIAIWNSETRFHWDGYARGREIVGWLTSGGLVPEPDDSTGGQGWQTYTNSRYGYRLRHPDGAQVYEYGVEQFDLNDIPEGQTQDEYRYGLYEEIGSNVCVRIVLEDGYILIEAPENWLGNYTFCRRLGPGAMGWSAPRRVETIRIEGKIYDAEGHEFIKIDGSGDEHDESMAFKLPSEVRIEFGAYSHADGSYERYHEDVLPVLIQILESFETVARTPTP